MCKWKQNDPSLNIKKAWPKSRFPDVKGEYIEDIGCFLVSIAITLKKFNLVDERFNPWVLHEKMLSCNAYDSAANLNFDYVEKYYDIKWVKNCPYSYKTVKNLAANNVPIMFEVPGINYKLHYVTFDKLIGNDVYVLDPADKFKKISEITPPITILIFTLTNK